MDEKTQANELRELVKQLRGGFQQDGPVIAELRALGPEGLFPDVHKLLDDPDSELRCKTALAIFYVNPTASIDLLVPLLSDSDWAVRVEICGLLHDLADKRAVGSLIERMTTDPNPMVRNIAAYALGGIGDPLAIPSLIETLDSDHEQDELGHSASGCAATALDNILKTNHTRVKYPDGLCTMQPRRLDLDQLKTEAMEHFRNAKVSPEAKFFG